MPYYYAKTDFQFFWKPYAQVSIQNDTATIFVNDFFTQFLSGFDRFGYALTHHFIGWDGSRMTRFDEDNLKFALLSLTEYPLALIKPFKNQNDLKYFHPNPWRLIDNLVHVSTDELVSKFQEKFPDIKIITCTPDPCDAIRSRFSKQSPIVISLAKAGIKVLEKTGSTAFIKKEFHDEHMPSKFVLNDEEIQSLLHPVEKDFDVSEKEEAPNLQNKTQDELLQIIRELQAGIAERDKTIDSLEQNQPAKIGCPITPACNSVSSSISSTPHSEPTSTRKRNFSL